jgi:hypothetical protein
MPDIFITMIKQNWNISTDEAKRILMMHESATKNQYLVNEQKITRTPVTTQAPPKKIPLGAQTFPSGQFDLKYLDKNAINAIKPQIDEYFKQFPENQKINVQVSASESKVPNQAGFGPGELAGARGNTVTNYLKTILPQNANYLPVNNLGAIGPNWDIKLGKNFSGYTNSQSISIDLSIEGAKTETIETIECLVDLSITMDYQREWCYATPINSSISTRWKDEGKCHECNEAVFYLYANGVAIGNFNLNNQSTGQSVAKTVQLTRKQAEQILQGKDDIILSIGCAGGSCHSDPAHITIINNEGTRLFQGFVSHGNERLGKNPKFLMKLNKCGKPIDTTNVLDWSQPTEKGRTFTNRMAIWTPDPNNPMKSYIEAYRSVDGDGIIRNTSLGPWDNQPWKQFVKYYVLSKDELKQIKQSVGNNP